MPASPPQMSPTCGAEPGLPGGTIAVSGEAISRRVTYDVTTMNQRDERRDSSDPMNSTAPVPGAAARTSVDPGSASSSDSHDVRACRSLLLVTIVAITIVGFDLSMGRMPVICGTLIWLLLVVTLSVRTMWRVGFVRCGLWIPLLTALHVFYAYFVINLAAYWATLGPIERLARPNREQPTPTTVDVPSGQPQETVPSRTIE
jgi:hypothetical protein